MKLHKTHPPMPQYSTVSGPQGSPCSCPVRYFKIDNCLHAEFYPQALHIFISKYNCKLPDSILKAVNLPRVYPRSKDCYQNQNTAPDSQVQQTAKPSYISYQNARIMNTTIRSKTEGPVNESEGRICDLSVT